MTPAAESNEQVDALPLRRRADVLHHWVSASIITLLVVTCAVAAWLGPRRGDDATFYFFERDPGHPGVMNAVTTCGFVCAAAVCAVAGLALARRRWLAAAAVLAVIACDTLMRIHNHLPGGNVLFRLAYWVALIWAFGPLVPTVRGRRGQWLIAAGGVTLALREVVDLFRGADAWNVAAFEESLFCIGTWCIALGLLGLVASLLEPASGAAD